MVVLLLELAAQIPVDESPVDLIVDFKPTTILEPEDEESPAIQDFVDDFVVEPILEESAMSLFVELILEGVC